MARKNQLSGRPLSVSYNNDNKLGQRPETKVEQPSGLERAKNCHFRLELQLPKILLRASAIRSLILPNRGDLTADPIYFFQSSQRYMGYLRHWYLWSRFLSSSLIPSG
jgi:hypothetical protein